MLSLDPFQFSISLLFFLLALAFLLQKRSKSTASDRFPPGPPKLPIVGHFIQLRNNSPQKLKEWAKKYGDILGIQLGPNRLVVLNNPAHVKEAWNDPVFNGRPMNAVIRMRHDGDEYLGVLFSEGSVHLEQRRFVLKNLRELGFGKKTMESLIMTEVDETMRNFSQRISKNGGKPTVIKTLNLFNHAILNVLWYFATGKRFAHDDPELKNIADRITQFFVKPKLTDILMQLSPTFEKLVVKYPSVFSSAVRDLVLYINNLLDRVIQEERETFGEGAQRHFIDVYLEHIKNCQEKDSSFYKNQGDKNLNIVILDFLVAGSETTSSTLTWAFLLLARHPEAQEKLYNQILEKVGTSRPVLGNDRSTLVYLEAFVMETLRFSSLAAFFPHRMTDTVEFHGFKIPENTIVVSNLYAIHRNPEVWPGDPEKFEPERFLSEDETSIVRNEYLMAFGSGKRFCIGESLAREELFLFIGNFVQRFKWSVNPDEPLPSLESADVQPGFGLRLTQNHTLLISDRLNSCN